MTDEFYDCLRRDCYVSSEIIPRSPLAVWPQKAGVERRGGGYVWDLYIVWKPELRGRVNTALVCQTHNSALTEIWESDAKSEVREQEVFDQWMNQVSSQLGP